MKELCIKERVNKHTHTVYCKISNISRCTCIPIVKKHALISEGVLILSVLCNKLVLSAWCAHIEAVCMIIFVALK